MVPRVPVPTHRSRLVPPGPDVVGLVAVESSTPTALDATLDQIQARLADGAGAVYGIDSRGDVPVDLGSLVLDPRIAAALGTIPVWTGAAPTLVWRVGGDPERLGAFLDQVEVQRADVSGVIVTDAVAETVRFLAVLAVLEQRAPMPAYDLADPSLKWHAPAGVAAVPNPPTILGAAGGPDAAGPA